MTGQNLLQTLVQIRRKIHQYPELGDNEFKTAALIQKTLNQWRIPNKRITKTGVVGILKGTEARKSPKCVALRADMDALPIQERTNRPYKSKIAGVMHACGHDAHVAMLLGAASILRKMRLAGTIKLIFQPNEEGAGGALQLIKRGVMKNPAVDAIFGLHVNPRLPAGAVGIKPGPLMASVDKFTIDIIGRGGHAAYPHEGRDPMPVACEAVTSLQTIVSRRTDPMDPIVLTVGTIQGGTRYNVLAEAITLTGTVRTLSEKTHRQTRGWMEEILGGVTQAHGATYKLSYETLGSVLSNDAELAALAKNVSERLVGPGKTLALETASMGGEDFAEYLKEAPGCFIYIGTGAKKLVPWHHCEFDIDERAMPVGSQLLARVALEYINQ